MESCKHRSCQKNPPDRYSAHPGDCVFSQPRLTKREADAEEHRENAHRRVDILPAAGENLDRDIGDEADTEAGRDVERERHRDNGEESGEGVREVIPVDGAQRPHHHGADDHEGG